ncbi:MAG: 3-isopropylmalate dehydratase small subunit [Candidatus Omnitrophica bacterium]|nr:3-isopropylmalate dehydratase small subunit [Candidatus Omnitrophota bacterium]MBU4487560.1 3-isopropylmalate dehydratase small subunit [Candidatus Omnitrophota bacterium]MCG2705800.1 3-isopropylmalate dehydratase small subunit [Candidatus Omnitrophota bacterium]
MVKGTAHRLDPFDNVNTDYVISGRYKFKIKDMKELSKYLFEDIDPNFHKKVKSGDYVIAGENFGCGSSREQAPWVIKEAGISAVLAKSFARIFFRNAFNIGLCVVECDTDRIKDGDIVEFDLEKGVVINHTQNETIKTKPVPKLMRRLLLDGGVIEHFKKHGDFKIEA